MENTPTKREATGEVEVRVGTIEELALIKDLWLEHYNSQKLNIKIVPNAFELWLGSMKPTYGRYAINFVAVAKGRMVGFQAGRVRTMPAYFGGGLCGYLTEICVEPKYRRRGVARSLVHAIFEWYKQLGIQRIETAVMVDNHASRKMLESVDFQPEQYLLCWNAEPPESS